LVFHEAEVVAVAQDGVELAERDWLGEVRRVPRVVSPAAVR